MEERANAVAGDRADTSEGHAAQGRNEGRRDGTPTRGGIGGKEPAQESVGGCSLEGEASAAAGPTSARAGAGKKAAGEADDGAGVFDLSSHPTEYALARARGANGSPDNGARAAEAAAFLDELMPQAAEPANDEAAADTAHAPVTGDDRQIGGVLRADRGTQYTKANVWVEVAPDGTCRPFEIGHVRFYVRFAYVRFARGAERRIRF